MQTKTIVVVDDDVDMNNALCRLLRAAGYRVDTFSSAEALIAAGIGQVTACLVLDIHLPGISGFELCRRLQQSGVKIPVIFITAYDDPESHKQATEANAIACITKPFSGDELLSAIDMASRTTQ